MKTTLKTSVWLTFLISLWFISDILDKGQSLNELTPYPVLGYVLWGIYLWAAWIFILYPLYQFTRIRSLAAHTPEQYQQLWLHRLKAYADVADPTDETAKKYSNAYWDLNNAISNANDAAIEKAISHCESLGDPQRKQARALIMQYSRIAGISVVFSRNNLVDGICLLVLQAKLVVKLAALYGYKPNPLFNILCFCWVITNSLSYTLLHESATGLADSLADGAEDMITAAFNDSIEDSASTSAESISNIVDSVPFVGKIAANLTTIILKPTIEAVMAGSTVYITGHIFLHRLTRDAGKLDFSWFRKKRRESYRDLATSAPWLKKIIDKFAPKQDSASPSGPEAA